MSWLWFVIPVSVVVTAFISGIFGMAGGLILMGVYLLTLPVATAMILHGVTQLASNGLRAILFLPHCYWRGVTLYLVGAGAAFVLFLWLQLVLDKGVMFLLLGALPFLPSLLPVRLALDSAEEPTRRASERCTESNMLAIPRTRFRNTRIERSNCSSRCRLRFDNWRLTYVCNHEALVMANYAPTSFVSISQTTARHLFLEMVSALQPLAKIPFR